MYRLLMILILSSFVFVMPAEAQTWDDITQGIADNEFYSVAQDVYTTGDIYVGTERGLYKKPIKKGGWQQIFMCRGQYKGVNDICITEGGEILIATKNGAYRSDASGKNWARLFKGVGAQTNCTKILKTPGEESRLYLGTQGGMVSSDANGRSWERFVGILGTGRVTRFARAETTSGNYLFIICNNDLYRFSEEDNSVKKIFIADPVVPLEESDEEELRETEDVFLLREVRAWNGRVHLATSRGIFISENSGEEFTRFNSSGLGTLKINDILLAKKGRLFAATERGVFCYDDKEKHWLSLYSGTIDLSARRLAETGSGYILAIFNNRIYLLRGKDFMNPEEILFSLKREPTIRQVQEVAIQYAEVSPNKIKRWREKARIKAILPKFNIGVDHSASDTYEIYTSSKDSYWMYGPRDNTEGWDMNLSWDLSELIWNPDQTTIDIRSKLMVQLRDDILDEVTRIYFERRRLQIGLAAGAQETEISTVNKKLRIDELTANLDAFTGGWFSRKL